MVTHQEKILFPINELISEFGISKSKLSKLLDMPESTFKLKLSGKYPQYSFKSEEVVRLRKLIDDMRVKAKVASCALV